MRLQPHTPQEGGLPSQEAIEHQRGCPQQRLFFEQVYPNVSTSPIGYGSYGDVHACCRAQRSKYDCAVKVLCTTTSHRQMDVDREVLMLQEMGRISPAIVQYRDVFYTPTHTFLVTELLEGESLLDFISKHLDHWPFFKKEAFIRQAAAQLLVMLTSIHAANYAHRDVKPANLWVAGGPERPVLRVLDLGMALRAERGRLFTRLRVQGTPEFMSPESIRSYWDKSTEVSPQAVDVWALGCTLVECFGGGMLFAAAGAGWGAQMELVYEAHQRWLEAEARAAAAAEAPKAAPKAPDAGVTINVRAGLAPGAERRGAGLGATGEATPLSPPYEHLSTFPPHILDFLLPMLTFDPAQRCTAQAALWHPYIREEVEALLGPCR